MMQKERINSSENREDAKLQELAGQLRCALPGIVQEVDLVRQVVTVQPALQGRISDYTGVRFQDLPLLTEVPIIWPRAGGFAVTLPIKVGDECLVVFGDRCIDAWWQSGGVQKPMDSRTHDLSDAFAIFAPTSQPRVLPSVQSDGIEIRDEARANWIKLQEGGNVDINLEGNVTAKVAGNVQAEINGNVEAKIGGSATIDVTGSATLKAASVTIDTPTTTITGNVTVNGTLTANSGTMKVSGSAMTMQGTMSASTDVTGGGISLKSHVHGGVENGPSTTSTPQ